MATEKNPFVDLSTALVSVTDEYKKHLGSINEKTSKTKEQPKEYPKEQQKEVKDQRPEVLESSKPAQPPIAPPAFSMPAAGSFSLKPSTSSSSVGQTGTGFKPTATIAPVKESKSPFSFPPSAFASSSTEKNNGTFGSKNEDKKESPKSNTFNKFSALGESDSSKKQEQKEDDKVDKDEMPMEIPPAPKPASAVPKPPTVPSLFNPSSTSPPLSSAPSTPSAFEKPTQNSSAGSIPNPFATKQSLGFGAALGEKTSQTSPGFSFGQASQPSGSAPPSESTPSKGGLAFTFGSASSLPSFPKPAEMDKAPPTPPKFLFGGASQSDKEVVKEEVKEVKEEDKEKKENEEESGVRTSTMTGEEDEDDIYQVKARLYRFVDGWKPSGSGLFKIKQNRENKKKRILHRDSTTTKILLVSVDVLMRE